MIDPRTILSTAIDGLLNPGKLWSERAAAVPPWKTTAVELTLPLIVGAFVLAGVVAFIMPGWSWLGSMGAWISALIGQLIGFGIFTFLLTTLAGNFGGEKDFDRGLMAATLGTIPGLWGTVAGQVSWIGPLLGLVLMVLALVYIWRVIPVFLGVPDGRRAGHYALTIILYIVVMIILSTVLGIGRMSSPGLDMAERNQEESVALPGFLGELARQGELMEQANSQTYEPPEDGRLESSQVELYLQVMTKAREMQQDYAAEMERVAKEMDGKENASLSDLGKLYGGASRAAGAMNAPMEVVQALGGNWREHVWVEQQLRTAKYQKDTTDAVSDNYALYERYREQLDALNAF